MPVKLRRAAFLAGVAGAIGSIALTLYAGRHNASKLLMLLFVIWVLSPFPAMIFGVLFSKYLPLRTQTMLCTLMLVLTAASLVVYGMEAFEYLRLKTGFVFLVVPLLSWLVIGASGIIAWSRRNPSR